jgi:hypothetical protein
MGKLAVSLNAKSLQDIMGSIKDYGEERISDIEKLSTMEFEGFKKEAILVLKSIQMLQGTILEMIVSFVDRVENKETGYLTILSDSMKEREDLYCDGFKLCDERIDKISSLLYCYHLTQNRELDDAGEETLADLCGMNWGVGQEGVDAMWNDIKAKREAKFGSCEMG